MRASRLFPFAFGFCLFFDCFVCLSEMRRVLCPRCDPVVLRLEEKAPCPVTAAAPAIAVASYTRPKAPNSPLFRTRGRTVRPDRSPVTDDLSPPRCYVPEQSLRAWQEHEPGRRARARQCRNRRSVERTLALNTTVKSTSFAVCVNSSRCCNYCNVRITMLTRVREFCLHANHNVP